MGSSSFEHNLALLSNKAGHEILTRLQRGIEKEGLRVDAEGRLALSPHPRALGSALTNPWLTTDFSESLLEFITPVHQSIDKVLEYMRNIHVLARKNMAEEDIWAASMPCILPEEEQIPIAQYGDSNVAKMKTTYRVGLGHRYGRAMQTVAGIHYNFSLPEEYWQAAFADAKANGTTTHGDIQDYINDRYLDLIRNFRRNYWLLIYLLGAAPCFDESFVRARQHNMERLNDSDLYLPHATSLRMGDLGYQSAAQQSLFVCYNELDTYIKTLGEAIHIPYPDYENIGIIEDGEYKQLSTALLQIENEFYSPIRPKRVTNSGETPLRALAERGIEYIEVRCLDINPFCDIGIDAETIRFLDAFLLHCLTKESALCDCEEFKLIAKNQARIVNRGRDPELQIYCGKKEIPMRDCARQMLEDIGAIAAQLDSAHNTRDYSTSIEQQRRKVDNAELTPSARYLAELSANSESHSQFAGRLTQQYASEFQQHELAKDIETALLKDARESLEKQAEIEASDDISFEQFLRNYYEQ